MGDRPLSYYAPEQPPPMPSWDGPASIWFALGSVGCWAPLIILVTLGLGAFACLALPCLLLGWMGSIITAWQAVRLGLRTIRPPQEENPAQGVIGMSIGIIMLGWNALVLLRFVAA